MSYYQFTYLFMFYFSLLLKKQNELHVLKKYYKKKRLINCTMNYN